jgi:UDPglucose 6-dehydrogenase
MKTAVVGTGHVGLVTGTCLAESGNDVRCIDIDSARIEKLSQGKLPLFEPGLQEMVLRNAAAGRLHFTTALEDGVKGAAVIFLALHTPSGPDGDMDLASLWTVLDRLAVHLAPEVVVVLKSTVPVGTTAQAEQRLAQKTGHPCRVAYNPEFFEEGEAVNAFLAADRVVVGVRHEDTAEVLRDLYTPFLRTDRPFVVMSPESAELSRFVASGLLAMKLSFINEMANLCERVQADIQEVRRGVGHDQRIGFSFLSPGAGYGGSCLAKNVRALLKLTREQGQTSGLLEAVESVNDRQQAILYGKMLDHFQGQVANRTIALWGLAFKPGTDDVREAPALVLIDRLLEAGAKVRVHDPEALDNVREMYGERLLYGTHPLDVLVGVDALAITTPWGAYGNPDFPEMRKRMASPVVFDTGSLYDPPRMRDAGFIYHSLGRPS